MLASLIVAAHCAAACGSAETIRLAKAATAASREESEARVF
jgi:hypothetical protein